MAGEGGMLTNNEELYKLSQNYMIMDTCMIQNYQRRNHTSCGFNYRMTISAAIVSVQLDKIDYIVLIEKIIIYWKTN